MNRSTFLNLITKVLNFVEGFLHNLCRCFDIAFAFAQLGVIPTTRNKFDEIAAAAECYLITDHVKNLAIEKHAAILSNAK